MNENKMTNVRLYFGNTDPSSDIQPNAIIIRGLSTGGTQVYPHTRGKENGISYIEAELENGLYCYKVYYTTPRDFGIKYFYIDGKSDYVEFKMLLEPFKESSYMVRAFSNTTDHVINEFYNTDKIIGFKNYATPAFLYHKDDRAFTTNEELCAFCEKIAEECKLARVFYPTPNTSVYGLKTPVMVFTKDDIPADASLSDVASAVRSKGIREIMMVSGGMHGNEPAGMEGVLSYALELCGEYGEDVLDKFGAIVLIPCVSADNTRTFYREYPDGCNSNRDLIMCEHDGSVVNALVYNLFMPTLTVSCHEDVGILKVDSTDYSIEDIHNVALAFNGAANTPIMDVNAAIKGEPVYAEHLGMKMMQSVIDMMNSIGYRAQHYKHASYFPATERSYSAVRGAFAYLIELSGIDNGKGNFSLRVHGEVSVIKGLADEVIKTNGAVAKAVYEARENVRVKKYDPENGFITKMQREAIGTDPGQSAYCDGTYKDKDALRTWYLHTKVEGSRPMPTAYVVPADLRYIECILRVLDAHNIEYKRLDAGAELDLRRYNVTYPPKQTVTIGDREAVRFDNGAYVVSTDSSDAYLIAYLFEPDSYPAGDGIRVSLFNMGFIRASDALYRCEENNVSELISKNAK